MQRCYNCAHEFESKYLTKEHIPPRCFSDAYPEEFKTNRITVDCCLSCNTEYSKIDSELRDMIAIIKDAKDGNSNFLEKGIKSVIRRKILGKDYIFDYKAGQYRILMDYELIEELFVKCHKGMFYYKYNYPIDLDFVSQTSQKMVNEKHNTELNSEMEKLHLNTPGSFIISGHKEIFKASLLAYKEGANDTFVITNKLQECFALSSYMVFHDTIDCLVMAVKKDGPYYNLIEPALS